MIIGRKTHLSAASVRDNVWRALISSVIFVVLVSFGDFELLVSGEDFQSYNEVFLKVDYNNLTQWFGSEIVLPLYYTELRAMIGEASIADFFFWHFLVVYIFLCLAVWKVADSTLMFAVLLVFVDYQLAPHLARQFISSSLVIVALSVLVSNGRYLTIASLVLLSFFVHNTAPIFFLLGVVFLKLPKAVLWYFLCVALAAGLMGVALKFVELLRLVNGVPVIGKAYFALEVVISSGESSARLFALVGLLIFILSPPLRWYERLSAGFLGLTILFYPIPILNSRVGLIGSSVLVGVPYWSLVSKLSRLVVRLQRGA